MSDIQSLVANLLADPRCNSCGRGRPVPHQFGEWKLPDDLVEFYSLTNGAEVELPLKRLMRIPTIGELQRSEPLYWGGESNYESYSQMGIVKAECISWLSICDTGGGAIEVVSLDLDPSRLGRCTFASHEMHCYNYEDYVIASSFTEWLERLLTTPGDRPYWEQPGFPRVSAYGS